MKDAQKYGGYIMQLDMHFYGVYALARAAGIKADTARIIAYASQFVDDAIDDDKIVLSSNNALLPLMTSHRPLDYKNTIPSDQWRVWIPFHFLPGNKGNTFTQKMICQMHSEPVKAMIENALDSKHEDYWPYLIGITAHVYADTFSHYGFIGIEDELNKVKQKSIDITNNSKNIFQYIEIKFEEFKSRFLGTFAERVPIGHGAVATLPDRPYLKWEFKYESKNNKSETNRDNSSTFYDGCESLFKFFSDFVEICPKEKDLNIAKNWDQISKKIKTLVKNQTPISERIDLWKDYISKGIFCNVEPLDKKIYYDLNLWRSRRTGFNIQSEDDIIQTDAYKFIKASCIHKDFVLYDLLPSIGLIVFQ